MKESVSKKTEIQYRHPHVLVAVRPRKTQDVFQRRGSFEFKKLKNKCFFRDFATFRVVDQCF